MSGQGVERALYKLANTPGAVLARANAGGGFGVFPHGDRRRRPLARLSVPEARALEADGILAKGRERDELILSEAGRARMTRTAAAPDEAFLAQHAVIEDRAIMRPCGDTRSARAVAATPIIRRLAALKDGREAPWFTQAELAAAAALHADWERGQSGLLRGSDWSAPPLSGAGRGGGNGLEEALARRCDATRRLGDTLDALAAPLRRIVEHVVFRGGGLEALERGEGWPARSAKLGLKMALAQVARSMTS